MAEIWVRRREHKLAEFIEVKGFPQVSVVFPYNIFCVFGSSAQVVLIHELEQFSTCDCIDTIRINQLEEFHWTKVGMSSKVLPPQFNLKKNALVVI